MTTKRKRAAQAPQYTPVQRAIARALEWDLEPARVQLLDELDGIMRTQLYRGAAYARLSGPNFAIGARRAYSRYLDLQAQPQPVQS